jgi:ribosome biogenesis GTPase / thiamine phosphate phosphatase
MRHAPGEATTAQVLAANVGLALVVESLPEPNERRAERLVALALSGEVPAALVLTKADLATDGQAVTARMARRLGVADAVAVSAHDGTGLAILRTLLDPGTTAALVGRSGAGKSTLVNACLASNARRPASPGRGRPRAAHNGHPRADPAARRRDGRRHPGTPVDRPLGRTGDGPGTAFADIERLAAGCRFSDCRHESEPGCAVREAVDPERLAGWRKLAREQVRLDDRKAAVRERKRSARALSRQIRAAERAKRRR